MLNYQRVVHNMVHGFNDFFRGMSKHLTTSFSFQELQQFDLRTGGSGGSQLGLGQFEVGDWDLVRVWIFLMMIWVWVKIRYPNN